MRLEKIERSGRVSVGRSVQERLRAQVANLQLVERKVRGTSESAKPWGVYRSGVEDYFNPCIGDGYELDGQYPELATDIKERVQLSHANGKKAVFLDVCGEADGKNMGFDHTITFSLTSSPSTKGITKVEGDIFSVTDRKRLTATIDKTLNQIDGELVYFNCVPVEGFGEGVEDAVLSTPGTAPEQEYILTQYKDMFDRIYARSASGGFGTVNMRHLLRGNQYLIELSRAYLREREIPSRNSLDNVLLIRKP